jgi:hypothetical protein
MGLTEQIRAGARLTRRFTQFTTDVSGIGSASIDPAYAIINMDASATCRIRLYDNESSRDDVTEAAREFGDTNVADDIALIGDFNLTSGTRNKIDPTLYAVTEDEFTYYRVEPAGEVVVSMITYTMEDATIQNGNLSRRDLPIISGTLDYNVNGGTTLEKGIINSPSVPTTYLLVSASLLDPTHIARLRLYSVSSSLNLQSEVTRSFDVEASSSAYLIADMILSGSQTTYFSPKIIGANLENMGTDLESIRGNRELINGKKEIYYILENKRVGAVADEIEVSLHVFSLEE